MDLQGIYDSLVTTRNISTLINITNYQQMPFAIPISSDVGLLGVFLFLISFPASLGQRRLFFQASLLALPLALFHASFWLESLALPNVLLVFWHMLLAFLLLAPIRLPFGMALASATMSMAAAACAARVCLCTLAFLDNNGKGLFLWLLLWLFSSHCFQPLPEHTFSTTLQALFQATVGSLFL